LPRAPHEILAAQCHHPSASRGLAHAQPAAASNHFISKEEEEEENPNPKPRGGKEKEGEEKEPSKEDKDDRRRPGPELRRDTASAPFSFFYAKQRLRGRLRQACTARLRFLRASPTPCLSRTPSALSPKVSRTRHCQACLCEPNHRAGQSA
jgi:hypothetical protein